VAAYLVSGLAWWLAAGVVSLWAAPDLARGMAASREVLLAAHLLGLGFFPLAVAGAALHVLPVLLRVDAGVRRGWAALPLLWAGPALAWGISRSEPAVVRAALAALALGLLLVSAEVAALVLRAPRGRVLLASRLGVLLAVAHAALALAIGAALFERPGNGILGASLARALAAHLHLAALGWLTLLIVAVGRTLAPMLALAPAQPRRRLPAEEIGLVAGLWVLLAGLLSARKPASALGAAVLLASLARFGVVLVRVGRTRRVQGMEGPLGHFLLGVFLLGQAAGLGLGMLLGVEPAPRRMAAYATLLLVGWAGGVTVGHVGKLLALALWSGWPPGPRPRQAALYPRRLWTAEVALFGLGTEVVALSILAGWPGPTTAGSALLLGSAGLALGGALVTVTKSRLTLERAPDAFAATVRAEGR